MKNDSGMEARAFARELRKSCTDAERLLWSRLRDRGLCGAKFRRQQPLGPYVVDFVSFQHKIIIEADGGQHATDFAYDEARTTYLQSCGYRVLRYWNNEILVNLEGVLTRIAEEL